MKSFFLLMYLFFSVTANARDIIKVTSPAYGADIEGNVIVHVTAPNFTNLTVSCWKLIQGSNYNSVVAQITLDAAGNGSFVFPADEYPSGPNTLTIFGTGTSNADNCYLQLYNLGGTKERSGIPLQKPLVVGDWDLLYTDDFDEPLSIGAAGSKYFDHTLGNRDFSYPILFTSYSSSKNPFSQKDTYLRIRADENKKSTGLISSLFNNKTGFKAFAPCYFECRMIGPNATGTWPAFWVLSMMDNAYSTTEPSDELDIIEAYGGEVAGTPRLGPKYVIAAHAWRQADSIKKIASDFVSKYFPVSMPSHGIGAAWYETFHTYGLKITDSITTYYCDDIEVGRHKTMPLSKVKPFYFIVNLGTGAGWPVDLSRYNGIADMYVDYVRVYGMDQSLPVTFGEISAVVRKDNLEVIWQTLNENNNDKYEIQLSNEGIKFSGIGEVKSKAKDGNSSYMISYRYSQPINEIALLMSVMILGVSIMPLSKRMKNIGIVIWVSAISMIACNRESGPDIGGSMHNKYIRLAQVDNNGKYGYSKIVKIVRGE